MQIINAPLPHPTPHLQNGTCDRALPTDQGCDCDTQCNNLCASFETAIPVPPGQGEGSVGGVPCMHAHTACYSAFVQAIRSPC